MYHKENAKDDFSNSRNSTDLEFARIAGLGYVELYKLNLSEMWRLCVACEVLPIFVSTLCGGQRLVSDGS